MDVESARDLGMHWNRASVGSTWMFRFAQHDNKGSDPPLPPHYRSDHGGNQRHEYQNNPAQPAQRFFVQGKRKRFRNFGRDANELLPTKQPVHTARNEVESLLILRDRVIVNKTSIANYYQTR